MKNRLIIFVILFVFFMVGCVSIGYSAFSTNLAISGDAIVRRDADIRITDLKLASKNNGGEELYSSEYSKSLVSMSLNLPATNSSVDYAVTITNKTGKYFYVNSISEVINSNSNVRYSISGLDVGAVYQGSEYSFNITFTTISTNQTGNVTLKFELLPVNQTVWTYAYTKSEQIFTSIYKANYKLEVWGAQGGDLKISDSEIYHGGYGGYSVGEISLLKNSPLYISVGGAGVGSSKQGESLSGGYNGGGAVNGNAGVNHQTASGGGATHIATVSGLLSSLSSNRGAILIVAGGGGGARNQANHEAAARWGHGGSGGGYNGGNPESSYGSTTTLTSVSGGAGTQNSGYLFGQGEAGNGNAAGGGGFFGGKCGNYSGSLYTGSGWGGSGYIGNSLLTNKRMYCYNCLESSDLGTYTVSTTGSSNLKDTTNCSLGFSSNAVSKCAKGENGFVKITLIPAN